MKLSRPGATPPSRLWTTPTWLLNHLAGSGRRLLLSAIGNAAVRHAYGVLAGLHEFGPISQAELSQRTGFDKGDLVRLLVELEKQGFVVRKSNRSDKRNKIVELTKCGREELDRLDPLVQSAQDDLLRPLSAADRSRFVSIMQTLLVYHEDYDPVLDTSAE